LSVGRGNADKAEHCQQKHPEQDLQTAMHYCLSPNLDFDVARRDCQTSPAAH
jgi:hypothetical protein